MVAITTAVMPTETAVLRVVGSLSAEIQNEYIMKPLVEVGTTSQIEHNKSPLVDSNNRAQELFNMTVKKKVGWHVKRYVKV